MDEDFKLFYRFNTGKEKKYLQNNQDKYYGIVISSHICRFYSDMVMTFLNKVEKPYFIDPVTYVFGLSSKVMKKDEGELKKSYESLIEFYGKPFSDYLGETPIDPSGLSQEEKEIFVEKTIELQENILNERDSTQESLKTYMDILGETSDEENNLEFLVPPYFYSKDIDDNFYNLTLELSTIAKEKYGDKKITPIICITKDILGNEQKIQKIAKDYGKFETCLIWLADFDERKLGSSKLIKYVDMIEILKRKIDNLISLYGGEFSILSYKFGLDGMVSGICYSSSKDPERVTTGGGLPLRYYIPEAHTKTVEANARIYYTKHHRMLCDCDICESLKEKSNNIEEFFDSLGRENAKNHFIQNFNLVVNKVEGKSLKNIKKALKSDFKQCKNNKLKENYEIDYSHLKNWIDTLSNYTK